MNPITEIQKQKSAEKFRLNKILQLVLLILFFIIYSILFLTVPDMRDYIKHSSALMITNIVLYLLMILSLVFLIQDLTKYASVMKDYEEQKNKSYLDELTGIPNRLSCDLVFDLYGKNDSLDKVGCAVISIANLADINRKGGRSAGNQALVDFSWMLEDVSESFGFVGRNGGNEFLLVINSCDKERMEDFFTQLDRRLARYNQQHDKESIEMVYEYVLNQDLLANRFSEIITEAYHRLYTPKKKKH